MNKNIFYAHKIDGVWKHIYKTPAQTELCGKGVCFKIRVGAIGEEEESESPYWAWKEFKSDKYFFVKDNIELTKMCSSDFFEGRIKRGEGDLVNVVIDKISLEVI